MAVTVGEAPPIAGTYEAVPVLADELRMPGRCRQRGIVALAAIEAVVDQVGQTARFVDGEHVDADVGAHVAGDPARDGLPAGEAAPDLLLALHADVLALPHAVRGEEIGDAGRLPEVDER